ncbi:MAG: hypothetical protein MH321_00960 [Leptospiraceae bacterium]|nr:hypothetical protein [Leptospiraceae bacterium]
MVAHVIDEQELSGHKTVAKCFPPQRLWQTQLAIGREEGKHGAYYDAKIGRFLQQDSMAFPNQINGMNRMMYVDGNPVGYRDPSGNKISQSLMGAIAGYIMAPEGQKLEGALIGYHLGRGIDKKRSKTTIQGTIFKTERWLKNNLLSGDKISRWYNRAFNNEKFKNTKENTISNVIQHYSKSASCLETYGRNHCFLVGVIGYGYAINSKKNYSRYGNLFNRLPIFNIPKDQYKLQKQIFISYGVGIEGSPNQEYCGVSDTDEVNNQSNTECPDVNKPEDPTK